MGVNNGSIPDSISVANVGQKNQTIRGARVSTRKLMGAKMCILLSGLFNESPSPGFLLRK
jgi:hypothetical protein